MDSLLKEVARSGTAARASATLKRTDIGGKTGTTNDSHDAWFAGYGGDLVAVAWMGFDQPRPLGERETGGGLALPIWISYMTRALNGVPDAPRSAPAALCNWAASTTTSSTSQDRASRASVWRTACPRRADQARDGSRADLLVRTLASDRSAPAAGEDDCAATHCRHDARQRCKEFTAVARVTPAVPPRVMMCAAARGQPELLHRRLAVDDDPGAVGQFQRQHIAGATELDVESTASIAFSICGSAASARSRNSDSVMLDSFARWLTGQASFPSARSGRGVRPRPRRVPWPCHRRLRRRSPAPRWSRRSATGRTSDRAARQTATPTFRRPTNRDDVALPDEVGFDITTASSIARVYLSRAGAALRHAALYLLPGSRKRRRTVPMPMRCPAAARWSATR